MLAVRFLFCLLEAVVLLRVRVKCVAGPYTPQCRPVGEEWGSIESGSLLAAAATETTTKEDQEEKEHEMTWWLTRPWRERAPRLRVGSSSSSSLAALDACSYGAHDSLPVASVTTTASAYSPHHNRFRLCSRLLSGYVTRVNYPNKTSGTKLKRERENLHNIRMHIKIWIYHQTFW